MGRNSRTAAKGCAILAAVVVGIPLLVVAVVSLKTWAPLQEAGDALVELDRSLGAEAAYVPALSGEISAQRMELFLELRTSLVTACEDYGSVQGGFEAVESFDPEDPSDMKDVGSVVYRLGGASLSITPFLARYFELRNDALLAALMGLPEYSYIYAATYHDRLLSEQTRAEIFSDGSALSPEASILLRGCLSRQLQATRQSGDENLHIGALEAELKKMEDDPSRLFWQDGLPEAVLASVRPYRERLDRVFCGATAGLEMERDAGRALAVALE